MRGGPLPKLIRRSLAAAIAALLTGAALLTAHVGDPPATARIADASPARHHR